MLIFLLHTVFPRGPLGPMVPGAPSCPGGPGGPPKPLGPSNPFLPWGIHITILRMNMIMSFELTFFPASPGFP